MKKILLTALCAAVLVALSACTTVVEKPSPSVHSSTTTTEETSVHRPVSATSSETRTIQSY